MKLSLLGLSVVLTAALAAACGGADQNSTNSTGAGGEGNSGGNGTGASSSGGNGTGASSSGGNGAGGNNTGGNNTGGNTGGNTGTGGNTPTPCGGEAGIPCDDNQYCVYQLESCGTNNGTGACVDKPMDCPDIYEPVCACDGNVYGSACVAAVAGVDIQTQGGCQAPGGTFACGAAFCQMGQSYCEVQVSDVGGIPNTYECKPLPDTCVGGGGNCMCLANEPCGDICEPTNGGFTLTCPGG